MTRVKRWTRCAVLAPLLLLVGSCVPPRIALGKDGFRYYLLSGAVSRAGDAFHGLLAHLWWPADRAWFVAAHFDFDCLFVGGTAACIDDIVLAPDLEAWDIELDDDIMAHNDAFNPLPPTTR